ncbi:MAG: serine/threonine-protein kinase [Pseudomonadota bacterium]
MFLDTVFQLKQQVIIQVKESVTLFPAMRGKPQIFRYWLLGARGAQIALVLSALLLPILVPSIFDAILEWIFPPVKGHTFFGLIDTERTNPWLSGAQLTLRVVLWLVGITAVLYLLLRNIPATLENARQFSRSKELEADRLLSSKPTESITLYGQAKAWAVDSEQELALATKIGELNQRLTMVSIPPEQTVVVNPAPNVDDVTSTVVISGDEEENSKPLVGGRYTINNELGRGAMGIVYAAEDTRLERIVALKQLSPSLSADQNLLARFRQEAHALARLSHPNIVQVYDFIEWNGHFWIAMELVEGEELDERLKAKGSIETTEALAMFRQMADALGYAHERGVVHRDFKPANVLINSNGDIKITDFGIAKLSQSNIQTQINTVMGSPAYMSPEQANGEETDLRTDIYALGIVLYQMLSGELPFSGDAKSIIAQHLTKAPPHLSENNDWFDAGIDALIQQMMEKEPQQRFQSMSEVIDKLEID